MPITEPYLRGLAHQRLKQLEPAVKDLEAFLASRPPQQDALDARYALVLSQAGLNRHEQAAGNLAALLKDKPDDADLINFRQTQAALLKTGLDGVKRKLDPGPPQQRNVYDVLAEGGEIPRVPAHLGEALDALEADEVVRSALPGRLYDVYMHYKRDEWEQYLAAVTDWEREKYLDVLP